MDPGMLALLTSLSPVVASTIAAMTGISGLHSYMAGHGHGDHSKATATWLAGGLLAGSVATAPRWIPQVVAFAQAMNF